MTITLDNLDFLLSPPGARLLERLAGEDLSDDRTLPLLTALRRDALPDQAGAALEMARLRERAVDKFGADAARMFFTRDALQQASDPLVRRYRAGLVAGHSIVDAGCGIGADSIAFARAGSYVVGLDIDPVRVRMAAANATALDVATARFDLADIRDAIPVTEIAFYDPARRDRGGRRIHDVETYEPPLSLVRQWPHERILVKLSPGVALDQLDSYDGRIEFISVNGDLKEAMLWLGEGRQKPQATLLTADGDFHWRPSDAPVETRLSEPRAWLVEPDPALLRAGLVAEVAAAFDGAQLDETIAYFTTADEPRSPWVRAWKILDWMPFALKPLRAYLRQRNVGRVTLKKRGTAVTPETLLPKLKLRGDESRTLVLTRYRGRQIVLICEDR